MRTMTIQATKHATARQAIEAAHSVLDDHYVAIRIDGVYLSLAEVTALDIEATGKSFAYLGYTHGKVMTVPVN